MKTRPTQPKNPTVTRVKQNAERSNCRAWAGSIAALLAEARRQSARSVNVILTATCWEIGRRIVEFVQQGEPRAEYGEVVLKKLSGDLPQQFGRGFSHRNLEQMRLFYQQHPLPEISQTLSAKLQIMQPASGKPAMGILK